MREWGRDKQPGDKLACPLCTQEFTLPSNGVGDLPKNFFVTDFLQMKELSGVESKASGCEACSDGKATRHSLLCRVPAETLPGLCRISQELQRHSPTQNCGTGQ